jgi:hypothetical protein
MVGVLQEVFTRVSAASWDGTLVLRNGTEDAELGAQVFTNVHDGRNITTAVAVIRGGPDRDNGLLREVVLAHVRKDSH